MKRLLLVLPLLVAPSCHTIGALLKVPGAAIQDVGAGVDAVVPGEASPEAEAIGQATSTGTTLLTGNAALGALAGGLATGVAALFLKRKKKPAP